MTRQRSKVMVLQRVPNLLQEVDELGEVVRLLFI